MPWQQGQVVQETRRVLGRGAVSGVPEIEVRAAAGHLAPEMLRSLRTRPRRLEEAGYVFVDQAIGAVIRRGLR